jgi:hypothetical protein
MCAALDTKKQYKYPLHYSWQLSVFALHCNNQQTTHNHPSNSTKITNLKTQQLNTTIQKLLAAHTFDHSFHFKQIKLNSCRQLHFFQSENFTSQRQSG